MCLKSLCGVSLYGYFTAVKCKFMDIVWVLRHNVIISMQWLLSDASGLRYYGILRLYAMFFGSGIVEISPQLGHEEVNDA